MEMQIFEAAITHEREDFFAFCFFSYVKDEVTLGHSAKSVCVRCQESANPPFPNFYS